MKKLLRLTAILLFATAAIATAQDKVYKTNGEVLETKVIEIGSTEIKYKVFANQNGPLYTIGKDQVFKIVYENGTTENIQNQAMSPTISSKRAQNVYVELGAQGLIMSANYDTRFSNKRNGIGGRVGIGAIGGDGDSFITVPVSLNYLLGDGKNLFEVGLGATYASLSLDNDSFFGNGGSTVIGTMAFMYRLQPVTSGFSFRGGFTPIFTSDGFQPYFGISLGYTF
ncbi:hypothetical protein [Pedobacter arcticus]|uniref:hypothetical protein n=1 Tax=Pedobacter arcticus TaxID=752140 RepID=UPI000312B280|nr:hypothetical protein [Pedobacter arcticus]